MGINRNKVLKAARKQVRKGNWSKAIGKYEQLVDDDPSDARSRLKIADLYAKADRQEEALDAYQSVARHYANDGIYEKAVAVHKQALRLAPDRPELHRDLGDAYHRLGRLKDAVRAYHKAQKIYKKGGDTAAQRELLERMIRLDPEDVGMRIQLAERYAKDDLHDQAVELFEFAAQKLDEEGRLDEFVQVAERIIFLRGDAQELRERVIDIYLRRGDNKHALKHLQVCFKKRPQDIHILESLIEAFERLERNDKAVLVMHELAALYGQQGRQQDAAGTYEKILDYEPADKRAQKQLRKMRRLDDSGALTGGRDTGPLEQRNHTPVEAQEVDALAGVEFLDDESEGELEVVPIEEPAAADHAPAPEQHRPAQQRPDDGTSDISGEIEVIEAVEPTIEHGPDTSEEEVTALLKETDVFIKYGLHDKAYDAIVQAIAKHPDSLQAHRQMKKLKLALGEPEGAVDELLEMARITRTTPSRATKFIIEALELTDDPLRVDEYAQKIGLDVDGHIDGLDPISVVELEPDSEPEAVEPAPPVEAEQVPPTEPTPAAEPVHEPSEAEDLLELDMNDLEFVEAEPDEIDPAELEADFERVESSVVEIDEIALDDSDLELIENTDAEEVTAFDEPDAPIAEMADADELGFDESDFDDADFVDMDVDISGLGELSDEQMVALDGDDGDAEEDLELYLSEQEADEMFDDLFADFDKTGERVNLGGDDPLGELAEVDFFLQQGLVDEAQEILERVRKESPDHPGIKKRANQIEQARQGIKPEDNPFGARSLSQKFHPSAEHEDTGNNSLDLGEAAFHNTSIELGTAYRDMGLYEEAIDEFKQALDDPDAAAAATYHIALCEIEKGYTDAAADRLNTLLSDDALTNKLREAAQAKLAELGA